MSCNPCNDCPPEISYTLPDCPGREPCEEILATDCVSYKGPNLPALGINHTDRLSDILTSLHKVVNTLISPVVPVASYTATNTGSGANPAPLVVTYLGLGPVYKSTPGATGAGTTITVGSTTGLVIGMKVEVTAGAGAFAANTSVTAIPSATTFVVSQAPSIALSGGASVITATGSNHDIFTISVVKNIPQTFKAFAGSPVKLSGTGTIV